VQGFNLAIRNKQEQLKLRMHHSPYMDVEETDARATGEVKRRAPHGGGDEIGGASRVDLVQPVRFVVLELIHLDLNFKFDMCIVFMTNYFFSGRRCPYR
jgi:hypothetical protein